MSDTMGSARLSRVAEDRVWHHLKTLFVASLLLFSVNILLGFLNAVTTGGLPRWQMLTHLHAGTIGWITLSVVGVAIWLFTGDRSVTDSYVRRVKFLVWGSVLAFAGYVASFGISFAVAGDAMYLLPAFGTVASLMVWAATVFVLRQRRNQPVVTPAHVFVIAALVTASGGALMGILAGLEQAFGVFLPIEPGSIISAHRAPMEVYVYIAGAALVAWFVQGADADRRGWPVLVLAGLWAVAGLAFPVGVFLDFQPAAILTFLLGLLLLPLAFVALVGRGALRTNPLRAGPEAWAFFGTVGLLAFGVVFFVAGLALGGPEWASPVMFHIFFVGMMTNLLFGLLSAGTAEARTLHAWAEPAAMWLLNGGLVVFVVLRVVMGTRHGAILMGLGVLLGVGTMLYRLLDGSPAPDP